MQQMLTYIFFIILFIYRSMLGMKGDHQGQEQHPFQSPLQMLTTKFLYSQNKCIPTTFRKVSAQSSRQEKAHIRKLIIFVLGHASRPILLIITYFKVISFFSACLLWNKFHYYCCAFRADIGDNVDFTYDDILVDTYEK